MDIDTLSPKVAATLAATAPRARNRNLRTDPKRMAVSKVWDSRLRGARKFCEEQDFVTFHNMPHIASVAGACDNTDLVNGDNVILRV